MKKLFVLLLVTAALVTSGAGCKKKPKVAKPEVIVETLDIEEVSAYRNPSMTKELM
jgi:hypothetical protein